eukprot:scpid24302/ scgid20002/ Isoleucine--tRNA ligase, cytoplasmic; Isoleucyl-tRNA synthetase
MAGSEPFNFPDEEEKIQKLWQDLDAFANCLKQSKGKPRYTFYDGPPFATGLPHYGHILAGTIKDIVTRYAHQTGHHVERRFGWDCHGLPVEFEIDKKLGIKSPDEILAMGIDKYNAECRSIVMRYSSDWERIVNRLGRWIDFKNDYKTLYPEFMESIWWVFKQLYEKGLVYRGFKVMPYSTGCHTPLSNFEANQNYKEVEDPAVIVTFPLDEDPKVAFVAWTTTPWTLPSNLALCVHPDKKYIKIKEAKTEAIYILMEARVFEMYKNPEDYEVLATYVGSELAGKTYQPLFQYYVEEWKPAGAFRVLTDTYVTEDSGTGIVHQAPAFGEDDYRVAMANGILKKGGKLVCPVDDTGSYLPEITDFAGQYVKDADKAIIKMLKSQGRLVSSSRFRHNYPFCWRSETPLIYRAVPSWFIRVEHIVDKLLTNNKKCYWVPEFVREKRFHNWLENARDWAVSRNRFWGTPMPIWANEDCSEVVCIGSVDELERLSGVRIKDLHRESVDDITIPSKTGNGVLRRIAPVFDCWFESGSMPYAQCHYPFENKKTFEESFPADFIAEGVDQTRGWFYTLLVISTALFDEPPYKNLIVNGLVLASDGKKMSKRLKNYPDPMNVVHAYGADALRLYLINSPVVRADTLRFKEEGVKDVVKEVFLPWLNAYRFLVQNIERLKREENVKFVFNPEARHSSGNIMDCWIVSFTQSLLKFVHTEMAAYRLYTVVPRLVRYIGQLTNWYVRFNRKRLKGENGADVCTEALESLFGVLYAIVRIMAPFTPFLTEHMYQTLRNFLSTEKTDLNASLHYLMLPRPEEALINVAVERSVERMQAVIELVRVLRDRKTMPTKYPLPEVVVIHHDQQYLDDVRSLQQYILEELNVKALTVSQDKERYGVQLVLEPEHQTLGRRLKGAAKQVYEALKKLSEEEVNNFISAGKVVLCGEELTLADIKVKYSFKKQAEGQDFEAHSDNDVLVLLDTTPSQEMVDEGTARAVVNLVQKLRKKAKLQPHNAVTVTYEVHGSEPAELTRVLTSQAEYIAASLKQAFVPNSQASDSELIIEEDGQIKGVKNASIFFRILKA